MAQATQITDIDLVMADRAFDSHAVFHVLDQYWNVDYLIPKKADSDDINADLARVKNNPEVISSVVEQSLFLRSDVPYIDREDDPTVDDDYHSHDMMFAYVPAENEEWAALEIDDTPYAVFATNRVMGPSLALDLTKKYSHRWDIENEYRMTLPFLPAIASRDDRMRYFAFVFSCLLYNVWRVVDHSLKTLAKERYDDYELEDDETRLDPVLPFSDMVLTAIVMLFSRDGLDPPDPPL